MKIAIASENNLVAEHFGRCQGYKIFTVENNEVIDHIFLKNPGHKPGFLPKLLSEKGVNAIIAGGMGRRAQELFRSHNIKVIVGVSGRLDQTIEFYISDELESSNAICTSHTHHGEGCDH